MASYKLCWKSSAERDFSRIDRTHRIGLLETAERLEADPFPKGCRKLQGTEAIYRIRVGQYRIVYQVDKKDHRVTVIHVRHRKDAYHDF